jgi:hypothetical protein
MARQTGKQVIFWLITLSVWACGYEKERQYTLNGFTVDTAGRPLPNVKLVINEEKYRFLSASDVRASNEVVSNQAGKFSQPINYVQGVFLQIYAKSDSGNYYVDCTKYPAYVSSNCRINVSPLTGGFPDQLPITIRQLR